MAVLVGFDVSNGSIAFRSRGDRFPYHRDVPDSSYVPDPIIGSGDYNGCIEFRSFSSCLMNIDYGDGTIEQYPFEKVRGENFYKLVLRSLDCEFRKNPDTHPWWFWKEDGSEYIPIPPHKYADGMNDKERNISIKFTSDIYFMQCTKQRLEEFPVIDSPSLKRLAVTNCTFYNGSIPFDRFARANNINYLGFASCSFPEVFTNWPEGLLSLSNLEQLHCNSVMNFRYGLDTSNVREVKRWKKLKNNNFNWNNVPYVKEFNDLPDLYDLNIISDYNDWPIFEPEKINPSIRVLNFLGKGTSWKEDLISGKGLENIQRTYMEITNAPVDNLPGYLKEMRSLTTLPLSQALQTQERVDTFVDSMYDYILSWENTTMSSVAADGLRNQFYGLHFELYLADRPYNKRPSGVLQAPDGFVKGQSNGNPTTPMEKIYVLTNNYNQRWTVAPEAVTTLSRSSEPFKLYSMTEVGGDVVIGTGELITSSWLFKFNSPFEAEDELRRRGMDASMVEKWFKQREEDAYVFGE